MKQTLKSAKPKVQLVRERLASTSGPKKRLHVDKGIIARNRKHGTNDPPITIQTSGGSIKAYEVMVHGSSLFVYSPDKPLSCGARLWIETMARLEWK